MEIQGIRAIVTGGAGGIGHATVEMLLQRGAAKIGVIDLAGDRLDETVSHFSETFGSDRIVALPTDLRDPAAIANAFSTFATNAAGIDVLINNAGILKQGALFGVSFKGISKFSLADWQEVIDINLTSYFICAQSAVELMVKKRIKGVIVNISSFTRNGFAGQSAYTASKGGVASLTNTLAKELAPYQIRCCAIAPGAIETAMTADLNDAYKKSLMDTIALKRFGAPAEIAHGIGFCIENDYFNGKILELDGGMFQ